MFDFYLRLYKIYEYVENFHTYIFGLNNSKN